MSIVAFGLALVFSIYVLVRRHTLRSPEVWAIVCGLSMISAGTVVAMPGAGLLLRAVAVPTFIVALVATLVMVRTQHKA